MKFSKKYCGWFGACMLVANLIGGSMFRTIFVAILLVGVSGMADEPKSRLEEANITSGMLVRRERTNFGRVGYRNALNTVPAMEVSALVIRIQGNKAIAKGAHFSVTFNTSTITRSREAFLDSDELDSLIASLNVLEKEVMKPNVGTASTVDTFYRSRSGFQVGIQAEGSKALGFAQLGIVSPDYILMKNGDFTALRGMCEKIKAEIAK